MIGDDTLSERSKYRFAYDRKVCLRAFGRPLLAHEGRPAKVHRSTESGRTDAGSTCSRIRRLPGKRTLHPYLPGRLFWSGLINHSKGRRGKWNTQ
jgi:hypothetical protein